MSRLTLFLPILTAVGVVLAGTPAAAQLTDVQWSESLSLDAVPDDSQSLVGEDAALPEPFSSSLSGAGYAVDGSVSFAPGAPNVTSAVGGDYQSGLQYLGASAYCRIDYTFAVRQTSPPPVTVTSVPVNVQVQGTAGVTGNGDMFANAFSSANLATSQGPLDGWFVSVSNNSGPPSDTFSENVQFMLAPDVEVMGDLTASAAIAAEILVQNSSATATAWVDPVIEVADETIPGSSAGYRDHYEIEFAPGYWSLTQVPARETTWGKIKRFYVD